MEQTNTPIHTLFSWSAPALFTPERSARWYMVAGVIVLAGAAYGIITGSWTLTVVCLLCGAMYYLLRDAKPPLTSITLTTRGVQLGSDYLNWEDVKGFWILQHGLGSELRIVPKKSRKGDLAIQTGTIDLPTLQTVLSQYTPELKNAREGFLDILLRICKL